MVGLCPPCILLAVKNGELQTVEESFPTLPGTTLHEKYTSTVFSSAESAQYCTDKTKEGYKVTMKAGISSKVDCCNPDGWSHEGTCYVNCAGCWMSNTSTVFHRCWMYHHRRQKRTRQVCILCSAYHAPYQNAAGGWRLPPRCHPIARSQLAGARTRPPPAAAAPGGCESEPG